jgi:hypothetical protein
VSAVAEGFQERKRGLHTGIAADDVQPVPVGYRLGRGHLADQVLCGLAVGGDAEQDECVAVRGAGLGDGFFGERDVAGWRPGVLGLDVEDVRR